MRKSRFTEEQIMMALRQGEAGTPIEEICRLMGISEGTYFRWKKKYAGLGISELRESSARVLSPETIRATVSRFKPTVKIRRPSAFRGSSSIFSCLSGAHFGPRSV
jgi:hypothetical protein